MLGAVDDRRGRRAARVGGGEEHGVLASRHGVGEQEVALAAVGPEGGLRRRVGHEAAGDGAGDLEDPPDELGAAHRLGRDAQRLAAPLQRRGEGARVGLEGVEVDEGAGHRLAGRDRAVAPPPSRSRVAVLAHSRATGYRRPRGGRKAAKPQRREGAGSASFPLAALRLCGPCLSAYWHWQLVRNCETVTSGWSVHERRFSSRKGLSRLLLVDEADCTARPPGIPSGRCCPRSRWPGSRTRSCRCRRRGWCTSRAARSACPAYPLQPR